MTDAYDPETGEFLPTEGHNSGFTDPEEQSVDDALHTLRQNVHKGAVAAGNRIYGQEFRKSLKAMLMAEHTDKPLGVQERHAYSHPKYVEHLKKMREIEIQYEVVRGERVWAERVIDVYKARTFAAKASAKL